jgi:Cu2+-containing amine oxidase
MKIEMTTDTLKTENKPAKPIASIEAEASDMIRLMNDFSEVLQKENDLLHKAKFREIETLQPDKRKYVEAYQSKIALLSQHKEQFAAMDKTLAEKLVLTRTEFVKILNKNLRALAAAKDSSRRLVQRILDTARDVAEDKTNYNATGAMLRSNPQSATSVRFNQEL